MEISKRQLQDEEVTAYHGGPHSFDKFSTQYMSTGEGGQAFGWGLYFTDLEDVAKYYAETIGNDNTKILGKINDLFFQTFGLEINHQLGYARLVHETIDEIKSGDIGIMRGMIRLKNASIKMRQFDDTKIGQFFNKVLDLERQKKYIYKVTLHKGKTPNQYTWLEWDKKIDKKTAKKLTDIIVSKNPNQYSKDYTDFNKDIHIQPAINLEKQISDMTGMEFYKSLSRGGYEFLYGDFAKELKTDKEASLFLLRAGIDGIKYPTGSLFIKMKTYDTDGFNYVVFDENAVNIEKQTQLESMEITKGELEEAKKARTKLRKKKKGDRCTRIAKSKYDVWPSAYSSGAVVRCRQGKIWKDLKEEEDETLDEKWSEKYKKSIDCNNPKGFSQKAHCKGRLKEEEETNIDKRKIYVLVGPPSVGKSTWIKNTFSDIQPYIISRDDIVEQVADNLGWTYDDLFVAPPQGSQLGDYDEKYGEVIQSPSYMSWQPLSFSKVLEANNQVHVSFTKLVNNAVSSGKDIVVDMTNMTAGARKNALKAIEGNENLFEKIAVVFPFQGAEDIIIDVARKRAEAAKRMGKSKTLPDSVMRKMFASFQNVSPDEAFDKVIQQDNRELLSTLNEKWSKKYKKSIDCNNPKGFSQKAHCKGRLKENWEDTSWANDGEEVTLKDLLNIIKNYPIVKAPIEKVKKIVIKKNSGGIESNRLNIADFKYPIIIIVDDSGNYQYILDGNHRANKAIDNNLKFIPAKLVNIKNLPQEFQNVLAEDETLNEKWSQKYKRSIDCNNPKGFSQKAHCKGRLKESKELFQNRALDKLSKVGGFELLPDIDKLALLGGSNDGRLKYLDLGNIYQQNGGTFGKLEIKVKIKDKNKQRIKHKFSEEFAGKEGYLFPYIHYDDVNQEYVIVRFDEFVTNPNNYGGGNYEKRPIMLANLYPIDYDKIKSDFVDYQNKTDFERDEFLKSFGIDDDLFEALNEKTDFSKEKKQGLHGWFARQGGKGKSKGWVDCNTCRDGKCKSCGRKEGEKRSKYPACRPTPSACKTKGKGKSWGKKSANEDVFNEQSKKDIENELKLNEIKNLFKRHMGKI
jgi:hypothetical protein